MYKGHAVQLSEVHLQGLLVDVNVNNCWAITWNPVWSFQYSDSKVVTEKRCEEFADGRFIGR